MLNSILLALSFWLHFVGAVIWVGGSLLMPLAVQPGLATLEPPARFKPTMAITQKMVPLYIGSILLVFASGIYQTIIVFGGKPNVTLSVKIFIALLMLANGIYLAILGRKMGTLAPAGGPPSPEFMKTQRSLVRHGWIQFGMGILILLVVGFLRAGVNF